MKTIKTSNYLKIAVPAVGPDLNTSPPAPRRESGPGKTLFIDNDESEEDIKKRWEKKKYHKKKYHKKK